MKSPSRISILFSFLLVALLIPSARAEFRGIAPGSVFNRGTLQDPTSLKGTYKNPIINSLGAAASVWFVQMVMEPGGNAVTLNGDNSNATTDWHCHPGPVMVCIVQGLFAHDEVVDGSGNFETSYTSAGNCLLEEPLEINRGWNASKTEQTIFYAMPLVAKDDAIAAQNPFLEFFWPVSGPTAECQRP